MQPRFAPDGKRIAFVSDRSGSDNVWTMDADGGNPVAVTADKTAKFNSSAEPNFSQHSDVHSDAKLRRFTPHALLDAKTRRRALIPDDDYPFVDIARSMAKLVRAGGNVALGSRRQPRRTWRSLGALGLGGLSPLEVLRAGTVVPAEALGLGRDLGSLEVGKVADLVVLEGNPLDDIRNTARITNVMKNGVLWAGDTMAEIWPNARPREPFFRGELPD